MGPLNSLKCSENMSTFRERERERNRSNFTRESQTYSGWEYCNYRSQICFRLEKNSVKLKGKLKSVDYNIILTMLDRLSCLQRCAALLLQWQWTADTFFYEQSWSRKSDCVSVKSSRRHCPQIFNFIYCHWRRKLRVQLSWFSCVSICGRDLFILTNLDWSV